MTDLGEIEALLFVAGEEGMSSQDLARACKSTSPHIQTCLNQLAESYQANRDRGITLVKTGPNYRLVAKNNYKQLIKDYAQSPGYQKLSRSMVETLAIIAYKQPITRMGVEEIRGVSASSVLQKLKARSLIKEMGHLEAPGKPLLYGTTAEFLDYFALEKLEDLPPLDDIPLNKELDLFDFNQNRKEEEWECGPIAEGNGSCRSGFPKKVRRHYQARPGDG